MIFKKLSTILSFEQRLENVEETCKQLRKDLRDVSDDLEYTQTAISRLRGTITGGRRGSTPPEEDGRQTEPQGFEEINQAIKEGRLT